MEKQHIISISREYGSGGHYIASALAKKFNLPIYDHSLLDHMAEEKGMNLANLRNYDGGTKKPFVHRTVRGMSNSPEEALAMMQFDFLKEKAKSGESFVVVGRCAEEILKDNEGLISIFVWGDEDVKKQRIMDVRGIDEKEAKKAMERHDRERRAYHNQYCDSKWGDRRTYDVCINSSVLGLDGTIEVLENYISHVK